MIDAHTHLYSEKYRHDMEQVIQRGREQLEAVVVSAVDSDSLAKSLDIQRRHPDFIHVTAGIHPNKAAGLTVEDRRNLWENIDRVRHRIIAVGEVGPDFHHTRDPRSRRRQLDLLDEALNKAQAWNLPLVVHARRAEAAALEVLSRSRIPVMFHCFAGSKPMAAKIAAHGFYLSFSAILLFNAELQEAVTTIPCELILTETDSPALSPRQGHPRNEPAYLETIVWRLAKLLNDTPQKTAQITAANARRFYGLSNHKLPVDLAPKN